MIFFCACGRKLKFLKKVVNNCRPFRCDFSCCCFVFLFFFCFPHKRAFLSWFRVYCSRIKFLCLITRSDAVCLIRSKAPMKPPTKSLFCFVFLFYRVHPTMTGQVAQKEKENDVIIKIQKNKKIPSLPAINSTESRQTTTTTATKINNNTEQSVMWDSKGLTGEQLVSQRDNDH